MSVWQPTLALDARYNVYRAPNNPQFRTLYIRRRSQLLQQAKRSPSKEYLKNRSCLLARHYGYSLSEASSVRSRTISLKSGFLGSTDSLDHIGTNPNYLSGSLDIKSHHTRKVSGGSLKAFRYDSQIADSSIGIGPKSWRGRSISPSLPPILSDSVESFIRDVTPTREAEASRAMAGDISVSENYAFAGMHHIFDQHKTAVVSVKFAHDDKSRLACCSLDGQISISQVIPPPATVICVLKGHKAGITDFQWSLSNDIILSSSLDGTSRVWKVSSSSSIRSFTDPQLSQVLCCSFHPLNNNLFVTGNSKGFVHSTNVSTGKVIKGGTNKVMGSVLTLAFDGNGELLWTGDDHGFIFSFLFDLASGHVTKAKRISVCEGAAVTSISCRTWISREARDPSLLVNCSVNALCLFSIVSMDGNLKLRKKFQIKQRTQMIRSTFCPLMSFRQGACVISGSEDATVYFFDIERLQRPCVNKLQGHSGPVLDVCFNYDESLLASCDLQGTVIIWKREQKEQT